jgi:hypothetical protein
MRAELLHYFCVQEHEKFSKEKLMKRDKIWPKHNSDISCCGNQHRQFREHIKSMQDGPSKKSGRHAKTKKVNNCVSLADKCPIHPHWAHTWGNFFQNVLNNDKKQAPAKGAKPGKLPTHEANLVDMNPVETPNTHACLLKPINESDLSRVNLQQAYMLELFNKVLGTPSNNVTDLLSKKVHKKTQATNNQTSMPFDSIQVLVSLDESVTHHLDELSLTADQ